MKYHFLIKPSFISLVLSVAVAPAYALKFEIPKELQAQADAEAATQEEASVMAFDSAPTADVEAEAAAAEPVAFEVMDAVDLDELDASEGRIVGRVVDKDTGAPLSGVAILLEGSDFGTVTDADGAYRIEDAPAGVYTLSFIKGGYIEANVTDYEVVGGEEQAFAFALPPRPAEMSDDVYELQDFSVTAEEANDLMALIDLKQMSVGQIDFLSAEDFAKFGGSNIADFVKRLAGVNVVEGQFAVVRGLGDRYNSTLVNNLPVPSPDPVRQGVQLDLFPTSVIESVTVDKAFTPSLPSNSSGAAFNLNTRAYPEEFSGWIELGVSSNDNAQDSLLKNGNIDEFQGTPGGSVFDLEAALGRDDVKPKGTEFTSISDEVDLFGGQSYKVGFGDTYEAPWGGTIGFVNSLSYSSSSSTVVGTQQNLYGRNSFTSPFPTFFPSVPGSAFEGTLPGRGLKYDFTESTVSEDSSFLLGVGASLDKDRKHNLDVTYLRSRSNISIAARRENGYLTAGESGDPDRGFGQNTFSNQTLILANEIVGRGNSDALTQGQDILSFEQRTLEVKQFAGNHQFDMLGREEFLTFDWGVSLNKARSEIGDPNEDNFVGGQTSLFYLQNASGGELNGSIGSPAIPLPGPVADGGYLFGGDQAISDGFTEDVLRNTARTIHDDHDAFRLDFEVDPFDWVNVRSGLYSEDMSRDVDQRDDILVIDGSNVTVGDTLGEFVDNTLASLDTFDTQLDSFAVVDREVDDAYLEFDFSFLEKFDIVAGGRYSQVDMTSRGSSFLVPGRPLTGAPSSFTEATLVGNSSLTNGDLLGFGSSNPADAEVEGEIDESYFLPAITFKYGITESLVLRLSYGQTYALPSARELSPVFTVDTFTGDRVVGNPSLTPSDVESFGGRLEYLFSDGVSNFGISLFHKEIEDPIEQIGLNDSLTGIDVQSYINNENTATVMGIELDGRLGFGLLEDAFDSLELGFLRYVSIGGNVAFIDAEVEYPGSVALSYFNQNTGESIFGDGQGNYDLPDDRRLFDQPEWTANLDVTFNHPDWGTRVTAALYAQSDVLSSVGTGSSLTIDQFTSEYYQVDLVASQSFGEGWELEFSIENLTDSERGIEYSEELVDEAADRFTYRVGRTYGVKLKCSF